MWSRRLIGATAAVSLMLVGGARASADAIRVRHVEGLVHGFLVLRDAGGKAIARGELLQSARGAQVTSQLVFYFKDGSLYDETADLLAGNLNQVIGDPRQQANRRQDHEKDDREAKRRHQIVAILRDDESRDRLENQKMDQVDAEGKLSHQMKEPVAERHGYPCCHGARYSRQHPIEN